MKKYFLPIALIAFVFSGCSSNDEDCECYYSDYYDQYVPNKATHDMGVSGEYILSEEQQDAVRAECKSKGC